MIFSVFIMCNHPPRESPYQLAVTLHSPPTSTPFFLALSSSSLQLYGLTLHQPVHLCPTLHSLFRTCAHFVSLSPSPGSQGTWSSPASWCSSSGNWEIWGGRSGLQELEPTVCPEDKFISTLRCLPGLNVSEYGVCVCVFMCKNVEL